MSAWIVFVAYKLYCMHFKKNTSLLSLVIANSPLKKDFFFVTTKKICEDGVKQHEYMHCEAENKLIGNEPEHILCPWSFNFFTVLVRLWKCLQEKHSWMIIYDTYKNLPGKCMHVHSTGVGRKKHTFSHVHLQLHSTSYHSVKMC